MTLINRIGNKKRSTFAILLIMVAGIFYFTIEFYQDFSAARGSAEAIHGFDVKDKRKLVGFAENVFVGRVIEQVGSQGLPTSKPSYYIPQTQFAVAVEENIKGNLSGRVTVKQWGGYYVTESGQRELELFEGDPLLVPGQTYLFITRYDEQKDWHGIVTPGYGDIPIQSAQQRARLVREFAEAYREQIIPKIGDRR